MSHRQLEAHEKSTRHYKNKRHCWVLEDLTEGVLHGESGLTYYFKTKRDAKDYAVHIRAGARWKAVKCFVKFEVEHWPL